MVYVFLTILIGLFVYLIITFKKNTPFEKKELTILLCIALFALCGIAYCIEPGKTTDLKNHFYTLRDMNLSGFNIKTSVDNIFVIKILFAIVAKINNFHLLSMFAVLITYGIYFYIFYKIYEKNKFKKINSLHIILLFLSLCNYYYVATGIKTGIAYSVLALAIYLLENDKKVVGYILMFISLFCHGSSLILIILYFLLKVEIFRKYRYALLFTFLGAQLASYLFSNIPIPIIQYIGEKIVLYLNRTTFASNKIVLLTEVIVAIGMLYRSYVIIRDHQDKEDKNLEYIYYIQVLLLLGLGTILISDTILERMLMLVAFFVPVLISYEKKQKETKIVYLFILDIVCSALLIVYFYFRLISHVTFL